MNTSQKENRIVCLIAVIAALFGVLTTTILGELGKFLGGVDRLPAILNWPLGLMTLALMGISAYAYPVGTGVLCYRMSVLLARPPLSLAVGLSVAISANLFMALQALPFLSIPAGTGIRPMAWSALMVSLAGGILVFGLIAGIRTILKEHRIMAGILGILLSLTPPVVGVSSLHLVCSIKGLEMEE